MWTPMQFHKQGKVATVAKVVLKHEFIFVVKILGVI